VGIAAALAFFCSVQTGAIWLAPVVVALGIRSLLRSYLARAPGVAAWLGAGLLIIQSYFLIEPLQMAWRLGCRIPIREDLIFIAVPVVAAALIRRGWPLFSSAFIWTGVMCLWCAELNGTCTASAASAQTVGPAVAGPRTDADGRWPAVPSERLAERDAQVGGGAADGGVPGLLPPGAMPGNSGGGSGPDGSTDFAALRGRPGGGGGSAFADGSSLRDASGRQGDASAAAPPAARDSQPRSPELSSVEGGWISSDYRSAAREMTLVSVEHANRSPDSFFESEGRRRVYLPTDPIFDATGTQVSQKGALQLARLAALLSLHRDKRAVIEVHTDASGSESTQLRTSELRAGAVREWLVSRGNLRPDQIHAVGAGARRPLVPPDGSYGAQQPNRRIEVHLAD